MGEKNFKELSEVLQSSNINFLLGAGVSDPFLPLLGNIEQAINEANDEKSKEVQYKKYFNGIMLPNKKIINDDLTADSNYVKTKKAYINFFRQLSKLILRRKSTILSKQINLFTTNVDILMETVLEELQIDYNDGFSGNFNPIFSIANYKKSIHQRSLHYDHISEIIVFNIIKLHGSLTWKHFNSGKKITFSHELDHFDHSLSQKTGGDFINNYRKLLVVNPEETKHLESVLNVYYSELLRMYSSELEKESATLFAIGFSMNDQHIREITLRAAKSNPTLRIYICCSQNSKETMNGKMELSQHPNIQIHTPENSQDKYTLDYFSGSILSKIPY